MNSEAEAHLIRLRGMLDDADQTPFGDMGKLLDRMAEAADEALASLAKAKEG